MKILLSSRGLFIIGFVILAATNIVVLSGVASNRSGTPETKITLTERELRLPYRYFKENSGVKLRLVWRTLGRDHNPMSYGNWGSPAWFNAEKLKALGFRIDRQLRSKKNRALHKQPIPKEVFIVLEYNGPPYREALKRAETALEKEEGLFKLNGSDERLRKIVEEAQKRLKRERLTESRLFAVDAGLDPKKLRQKYEDRTRFIITKGLVKPRYHYKNKKKKVVGCITKLSVEKIHVPLKHRKILDGVLAAEKSKKHQFERPRYKVELAYGSRLEPWVVSVGHMGDQKETL